MKKGMIAVIAILILLVIGVLIWNANQNANTPGDTNGGDVVDNGGNGDGGNGGDNGDNGASADPGNDTTDGSGIDNVPTESDNANVKVMLPDDGQKVGVTGLTIVGEARVFENTVSWRVKDASGAVLDSGTAMADASDIGQFGTFVVHAEYVAAANTAGTVEAYAISAMDGSEIEVVTIPVKFVAERAVPVYFGYEVSSGSDCTVVHGSERMIPKDVSRRYAMELAIWELLMGITDTETDGNFASSIPAGVVLNSLKIAGNTVTVDFSNDIEAGGSCRVGTIRAQIEETLKGFPGVDNVVITVASGNPDEALQP